MEEAVTTNTTNGKEIYAFEEIMDEEEEIIPNPTEGKGMIFSSQRQ